MVDHVQPVSLSWVTCFLEQLIVRLAQQAHNSTRAGM